MAAVVAEFNVVIWPFTNVLTANSVGNLTLATSDKVTSVDLLAVFSFKLSAACVAILIGLFKSDVLLTFSNPKFVLAPITVVALVPPFAIGTIPVTFVALFAAKAKGT